MTEIEKVLGMIAYLGDLQDKCQEIASLDGQVAYEQIDTAIEDLRVLTVLLSRLAEEVE